MESTGHCCTKGVHTYKRATETQHQAVLDILSAKRMCIQHPIPPEQPQSSEVVLIQWLSSTFELSNTWYIRRSLTYITGNMQVYRLVYRKLGMRVGDRWTWMESNDDTGMILDAVNNFHVIIFANIALCKQHPFKLHTFQAWILSEQTGS